MRQDDAGNWRNSSDPTYSFINVLNDAVLGGVQCEGSTFRVGMHVVLRRRFLYTRSVTPIGRSTA